jgi:hypothetical protein
MVKKIKFFTIVFDVTKCQLFGKGGAYSIFAGHDASICLAKDLLDTKLLNNFDLSDLNLTEKMQLRVFSVGFKFNFKFLGTLKEYIDKNPE